MSELSLFSVALFLPLATGTLLARLIQRLGANKGLLETHCHPWPGTVDREDLLNANYKNVLMQLDQNHRLLEPQPGGRSPLSSAHDHLQAMMQSLDNSGLLYEVVAETQKERLAEARANLLTIKNSLQACHPEASLKDMIEQTDLSLRTLTMQAHAYLADIEREVTTDLVGETLNSLGYRLETRDNRLLGKSGDMIIRAGIETDGRILLDTTSYSGLSCQQEIARFESKLKENGVLLKRTAYDRALRKPGGVLLNDPFPPLGTRLGPLADNSSISQSTEQDNPHQQDHQVQQLRHQLLQKKTQRLEVA